MTDDPSTNPPLVWDPPPTPCTYRFPLPSWASEDQMDRCKCDLTKGHPGEHECRHTRAEADRD